MSKYRYTIEVDLDDEFFTNESADALRKIMVDSISKFPLNEISSYMEDEECIKQNDEFDKIIYNLKKGKQPPMPNGKNTEGLIVY
jgi:hypothetical protein